MHADAPRGSHERVTHRIRRFAGPSTSPCAAVGLFLLAIVGVAAADGGGDLEQRAIEVRAFIDSVAGGIDTLRIPHDIHDLPQPLMPNGEIDPRYEITEEKAALGKLLFHDPALSSETGHSETLFTVSCASCHFAEAGFRAGQARSFGAGARGFVDEQGKARRSPVPSLLALDVAPTPLSIYDALDNPGIVSPSINMSGYFNALNWNGLAIQFAPGELPPIERQMRLAFSNHRLGDAEAVATQAYVPLFEAAFPELVGQPIYVLINLETMFEAIGAYERTVVSNQSRWDGFLAGDNLTLSFEELHGAELFFGEANCVACHLGPALGSTTFHALGVAEHPAIPAGQHDLGRFVITQDPADLYKYRAMTVRSLKGCGPFFHGGSAATIEEVIRYKNAAVPDQDIPTLSPLFVPLNLTEQEILDLTAFVEEALYDPNMSRFAPTTLPSGLCLPHDDQTSRYDTGCDAYGDFDDDGDVDLVDFSLFQTCFGGDAGVTVGPCASLDRDGDEVVDLSDYTAFVTAALVP